MRRPPPAAPRAAGRRRPAAAWHHVALDLEAAGGGICICLRGGPWPPIDVIEPRDPAECKDWFEAMRLRTTGTSGGGHLVRRPTRCDACALTRCVWTTMGPDGWDRRRAHRAKLFAR